METFLVATDADLIWHLAIALSPAIWTVMLMMVVRMMTMPSSTSFAFMLMPVVSHSSAHLLQFVSKIACETNRNYEAEKQNDIPGKWQHRLSPSPPSCPMASPLPSWYLWLVRMASYDNTTSRLMRYTMDVDICVELPVSIPAAKVAHSTSWYASRHLR
jgi:hypothetical protein